MKRAPGSIRRGRGSSTNVTVKADAKKRATPRKPTTRSSVPRRPRQAGETGGTSAEGGEGASSEGAEDDPEALGDEREVFDTEAEVIDAADADDADEEREPGEETEASADEGESDTESGRRARLGALRPAASLHARSAAPPAAFCG